MHQVLSKCKRRHPIFDRLRRTRRRFLNGKPDFIQQILRLLWEVRNVFVNRVNRSCFHNDKLRNVKITRSFPNIIPILISKLEVTPYTVMKTLFILLLISMMSPFAQAQTESSKYNKALADSLGADEYGMKMYVMVILKSGSNKTQDTAVRNKLFVGHMANINRMAAAGKLVVAGPFEKNAKGYRGIFILNVPTIAEATTLLETDPAVHAKIFEPELYEWYGSAALPIYMKYNEVVKKKSR